jgi:hypothetical protein
LANWRGVTPLGLTQYRAVSPQPPILGELDFVLPKVGGLGRVLKLLVIALSFGRSPLHQSKERGTKISAPPFFYSGWGDLRDEKTRPRGAGA